MHLNALYVGAHTSRCRCASMDAMYEISLHGA
jgi:hypothetical protein